MYVVIYAYICMYIYNTYTYRFVDLNLNLSSLSMRQYTSAYVSIRICIIHIGSWTEI